LELVADKYNFMIARQHGYCDMPELQWGGNS